MAQTLPVFLIAPVVNQSLLGHYHQTLTWQISEKDWEKDEDLFLNLNIPRTFETEGGGILLTRGNVNDGHRGVSLCTSWPFNVNFENICVNAKIKFKRGSEEIGQLSLKNSEYIDSNNSQSSYYILKTSAGKFISVNPTTMKLFDVTKSFTLQAEIVINKGSNTTDLSVPNELVKDLVKIFNSEETSAVDVECGGKVFKCRRNILCARSVVCQSSCTVIHKNMSRRRSKLKTPL